MTRALPVQRWRRAGLVLEPDRRLWWSRTHAMVPTPLELGDGLYRVYYSGRDDHNRSHVGWFVLDLNEPVRVVDRAVEPVLSPGDLGCFDDNGVTPSCVVRRDEGLYLYYIGWNPGSTVRMHIYGGLAIGTAEGDTFERWSRAPILERCRTDPLINTAPWVVPDGESWRIYYVSGVEWVHKDLPRYLIKTGVSADGCDWADRGRVCIDFAGPREVALARPYVVRSGDGYRMWFSHKSDGEYRMGYAESRDGVSWVRDDDACDLDVSASGFDDEMVCYAAVVSHAGQRFMLYNGNGYGVGGIGLAVEEGEASP